MNIEIGLEVVFVLLLIMIGQWGLELYFKIKQIKENKQ